MKKSTMIILYTKLYDRMLRYRRITEKVGSENNYSLHKKCLVLAMKSLENDYSFKDGDDFQLNIEYEMNNEKRKVTLDIKISDQLTK